MSEDSQKLRLFVAIFPTQEVVANLQTAIDPFRKHFSPRAIRWTPPDQVHLTMNFIGSAESNRLPEFEAALEGVSKTNVRCFLRSVALGCFPNAHRPRVLWAGLTGELHPLSDLKKSLDQSLNNLGFPPEERPFHPHLTLGRINQFSTRDLKTLEDLLNTLKTVEFGNWQAKTLDLMQSTLSPSGSTYKVLNSFPLKNP